MTSRSLNIIPLNLVAPATRAAEEARAGASFESLREAELKYRSIFENAIHGIYQSVTEGHFVNVNPALARMLGYDSPADMIACCADIARDYYAQTDGRAEFLALVTERGRLQGYEVQVRRKDGTALWTRENVCAVRDAHGHLLYYEGSVEDITAQKQAEAALRESEERYRALFENANDVIYTIDLAGNYTSVNKVGEHITGYTCAELCQLNFTQLVAPEHLAHARAMMTRKLSGQEATTCYELEIVNRAGARVLLEVSTQLIYEHGVPVGVQGIARNITERKRAEDDLRASEERFKAFMNNSPAVAFIKDETGRMVWINEPFERLFQTQLSAVQGKDDYDLWTPEVAAQLRANDRDVLTSGRPLETTESVPLPDGSLHHWLSFKFPLRAAAGQTLLAGMAIDITERKQAEAALRESEERYRELFENANDLIYTHDLTGNFTSLNHTGERITGYTRTEAMRMNIAQVVAPEHLQMAREMIGRKQTEGEATVYELDIVAKDGRRVSLELSTRLIFAEGRPVGVQGIARDITERKHAEERLRQHALADALTGLPNRLLFTDHLKLAVEQSRRQPAQRFAVLFLDLDRFKMINDSLGHGVGDQLLIAIARQLEHCIRAGDTVARLGGDEFAILLNDIAHYDDAIRVAERVLHELKLPFKLAGHEVFTSASIGIALSNNRYQAAEDVLRDADTAMYRAKADGKARYEVFDMVMHARVVALLQLENDLRRAIEREEFRLHYQPIVALADGRITGFEALVRWPHAERGLVRPAEFIALAEETGLIVPLGRWVLHAACAQMRRWQNISPAHARLKLNVNLSGRQFAQTNLCGQIERTLAATNFDPRCLQLEITESVLMENAEAIVPMLQRLRDLGVELAIDDFGTGYSSLSYLRRFPIQTLKIDRSFISGGDEEDAEIVRTIVLLARNMRKDVCAEGIETPAQLAQLRALDCAYGQGYFFSAPQDAVATERMLRHALDRDLRLLPVSDECVA